MSQEITNRTPGSASRLPPATALAIGSMPHRSPDRAVDLILDACPEAPCWPQLPALGFQENMMAQFSEGVPCLRVDPENQKLSFSRSDSGTEELTRFYERCIEYEETGRRPEAFGLSPAYAVGLHAFLEKISARQGEPLAFIKGQITGPLTFGLSILDENGLPALFDETFSDVVSKAIQMKALWQIDCLKPLAGQGILFVDEPILAGFGSAAYINLSREQAVSTLRETVSAVKATGFLVGSHCCANTDWSIMVEAGVDIINFDAYAYTESIGLYASAVSDFLLNGGYLAWGIVPSNHLESRPGVDVLYRMIVQGVEGLKEKGLPAGELVENMLLSTSCGLGTLSEEEAEAAMAELRQLSRMVRENLKK
jgi:methionine synthase II (cobalamin-independent)